MKPRARKCNIKAEGCRISYTPFSSMQPCCLNMNCSLEVIRRAKSKAYDAKTKEMKSKVKQTKPQMIKLAEYEVRFYVRMRDKESEQPCISCGRHEHELGGDPRGGLWDAGHYAGKGAHPELRFNTDNIHRQCVHCNRDLSGNPIPYRKNLIERIGLEKVEWLEGPHPAAKWTIDELTEIKQRYNRLANEIKKRLN